MTAEEQRLKRLRRLEKVRAIAKQTLAAETAQAEGTLAQLTALTNRTRALADDYATRSDAMDGQALRQNARFVSGLYRIAASAGLDANNARVHADRKLAELATAERRRAAVEQRVDTEERAMAKRSENPASSARKRNWHDT